MINLNATTKLKYDLVVPIIARQIKGDIFWDDGSPITGDIEIFLTKSEKVNDIKESNYDSFRLSEGSEFVLNGFENAEYWIHFQIWANNNDENETEIEVKAKPVKIKVGKTNEPLKILIPKPANLEL